MQTFSRPFFGVVLGINGEKWVIDNICGEWSYHLQGSTAKKYRTKIFTNKKKMIEYLKNEKVLFEV
jgi:hypothetical protein